MQVGEHRVQGILAHFQPTGDVQVLKCTKDKVQCTLCDEDVEVCKFVSLSCSCTLKGLIIVLDADIAEVPDLYLDKLRLELEQIHGVSMSLSTIWRALINGGYTMKKVCRWNYY